MEVEAFLADSVVVAEQKLYVQGGGWDAISTGTLPARHSRLGLAVLIRVPYTATNQNHRLAVRLMDEDGAIVPLSHTPPGEDGTSDPVKEIEGQFNVGRPPTLYPGDEQVVPLAVNIEGLVFEKPGAYHFVFEVDGTEIKKLPFRVNLIQQPFRPTT